MIGILKKNLKKKFYVDYLRPAVRAASVATFQDTDFVGVGRSCPLHDRHFKI